MTNPVDGWTDARFMSFLRSALRRAWTKFPNKFRAINAARLPQKGLRKGRRVYLYKCNSCKESFTTSQITVDHIEPCGSLRSFDDLPSFAAKLFCPIENLQVLCKKCHHAKTMAERGINPEVANFKKLKAAKQKERLRALGLPEGNNAKERIEIFERNV